VRASCSSGRISDIISDNKILKILKSLTIFLILKELLGQMNRASSQKRFIFKEF
jgi:hypothetical protein